MADIYNQGDPKGQTQTDPDAPERGIEKAKDDWEGAPPTSDEEPIDLLKPGSSRHKKVLQYLLDRLNHSERKMSDFYSRWAVNEMKTMAYINLPDYEKALKSLNDKGHKPQPVSIVVPFQFATISTIVTYLLHTFTGRKPMFQVGSYKSETADSSRMMEMVLQYNADHTRMIRQLFNFLQNTQQQGVGILRTLWREDRKMRTVNTREGKELIKRREKRIAYQGNDVEACDPYMFFPDPRVPMHEVNRKGEFVFWRNFDGRHMLKRLEADGTFKFVDNAARQLPRNYGGSSDASNRDVLSGVKTNPGARPDEDSVRSRNMMQVDQGTVEIIPAELGLGQSDVPEKWLFTILNKSQIIQAVPFDADHDMHPVAVAEPYTMGQTFGSPSITDYLGPLQDMVSWLINSHQENVRKVLNDMIIVDPSRIEMQDLKTGKPGKIIRLKQQYQGTDVRAAIQQFQVTDVTQNHVRDAELFMRLGQQLSAVTENVMGMQDQGGRKTATEVRTTTEAAASRLASQGRIISAQALVDNTEQMAVNLQQYMTEEFFLQVVGQQGRKNPIHVGPEQISGDFYYPTHDGTLPLDRVALFDIWGEMFQVAAQDEEIRQAYSIPKMFEQVAELGGIRNIDSMRIQEQSDEQIAQGVESGNLVPANEANAAMGDGGPMQQEAGMEQIMEALRGQGGLA